MRFSGIWHSILSDIRYASRTLRQSPALVAVAVLSIALGVGANTAVFTLVDQVLLRQLPVTRPHELVLVTVRGTQYGSAWGDGNELSYLMYEDLRGNNEAFTGMFCRFGNPLSLSADGRIEPVASELVSGTYSKPWVSRRHAAASSSLPTTRPRIRSRSSCSATPTGPAGSRPIQP